MLSRKRKLFGHTKERGGKAGRGGARVNECHKRGGAGTELAPRILQASWEEFLASVFRKGKRRGWSRIVPGKDCCRGSLDR